VTCHPKTSTACMNWSYLNYYIFIKKMELMNIRSLRHVMHHVKIRSLLGHTRDIAMLYSHATRFVSRFLSRVG
jgi:hypothetical protein